MNSPKNGWYSNKNIVILKKSDNTVSKLAKVIVWRPMYFSGDHWFKGNPQKVSVQGHDFSEVKSDKRK